MRALSARKGVIPRGYPDHRRAEAWRYRAYCTAIQAAWGPLPPVALLALREAGRIAVELERLGNDLETARRRKRRKDASRIRRQQTSMRAQLLNYERRIEELAAARRATHVNPLADVHRAVAEANR